MGMRAIRICLTRVDLFKTQLRALLRASAYGKIAIMFPMIIPSGKYSGAKKSSTKSVRNWMKKALPTIRIWKSASWSKHRLLPS